MDLSDKSRKEIGDIGERTAAEYLKRRGFRIRGHNIGRKTGELDIVAERDGTLHAVEVKTMLCGDFPEESGDRDEYDPAMNLHEAKVRRVARTAEWYVAETDWEGEWQVDGALVWLRERDGMAKVQYLPQIV